MKILTTIGRDARAASAAEFALVLPLLIILLFGVIDAGRFMWLLNRTEKATQMGVRMAVVTDPVSDDLREADFAGGSIQPGDLIPASALGTVLCTSSGCTCEVNPCPFNSGDVNSDAFNLIVERMSQMNPLIEAENVRVRYSGSGFGYAGSSAGGGGSDEPMEIHPLVTVSAENIPFEFIALLGIGQITMPPARATLTAEDSSGTFSN